MYKQIFFIVYILLSQFQLFSQTLPAAYNPAEIIVVTNRQQQKTSDMPRFDNIVDPSGNLGFYLVEHLAEDKLHVTLVDSSFFASRLTSRNTNWVLFVHGDSKTFEEAALRGLKIQNTHNISVVVFSWPTKEYGFNGSKNFKNSKLQAKKTYLQLASLLHIFEAAKENQPNYWEQYSLSLFVHSLGNYLIELLSKDNLLNHPPKIIFDNIILNSAAVNQKNHESWLGNMKIQNQIFVTSNRHDFNLKGVRIFTSGGKQLGEIVKPPLSENAYYIDFSKSVGFRFKTGRTHSFYIGYIPDKSDNIRCFYTDILHGRTPDFMDGNKYKPRKGKNSYNIKY